VFLKNKDSKTRKREVIQEAEEDLSDSPEERRVALPKGKREQSKEKKSNKSDRALQALVAEFKQVKDAMKAATQSGVATVEDKGSSAQKPMVKRDMVCRHCNKTLKNNEK
jgi:hypothetical protein